MAADDVVPVKAASPKNGLASGQDPRPNYAPNEVHRRLRSLQPRRHVTGGAPWQ